MRVIAIESLKDGKLRSYGEGDMEHRVPDQWPWNENSIKNPCIKLDSGQYVWGFQCWWFPVEQFKKDYEEAIKNQKIIKVKDEILPLNL